MVTNKEVKESKKPAAQTPVFLGVSVEEDGNYIRNFN